MRILDISSNIIIVRLEKLKLYKIIIIYLFFDKRKDITDR